MGRKMACLIVIFVSAAEVHGQSMTLHGVFPVGIQINLNCRRVGASLVGSGRLLHPFGVTQPFVISSGSSAGNVVNLQGHFVGSSAMFIIQAAGPQGPIYFTAANGHTSQGQGTVTYAP